MPYWRHIDVVTPYVPADHTGTRNRRLVSWMDEMEHVELIIGEMDEGGSAMWHAHVHREKVMYILEGWLWVAVGQEKAVLTVGHAIWIPKTVAHAVKNPGPGKVRFVLIYGQAGFC